MKFYLKFQASVLMLFVYDFKLPRICEDSYMMCTWFLQYPKDCYHMDPALMPSHIIWLDFSNKDVSDGICLKEVTLLHKILCFTEWFKLFICFWFWWIKIIMLMYSCLTLWNAASLSVEFIMFNELCKNSGVVYNKAYNSQKKLFITIFKEHTSFNNFVFEIFEFNQSQLD